MCVLFHVSYFYFFSWWLATHDISAPQLIQACILYQEFSFLLVPWHLLRSPREVLWLTSTVGTMSLLSACSWYSFCLSIFNAWSCWDWWGLLCSGAPLASTRANCRILAVYSHCFFKFPQPSFPLSLWNVTTGMSYLVLVTPAPRILFFRFY